MKYEIPETLPKMLKRSVARNPDVAAQYSKDKAGVFQPISFNELFQLALDFGAGLLSFGTVRGELVGLISDNRKEWEQADMGIMAIGASDVPRGCDATVNDLRLILSLTASKTVVAENPAQLEKIVSLKNDLPTLERIILFDAASEDECKNAKKLGIDVFTFAEVLVRGKDFRLKNQGVVESELEQGKWDDVACVIFTSGTTGTPKGVMLTHGNFLTQLDDLQDRIYLNPGESILCVLPIWHAFQRICEYVIFIQNAALAYSKPVGSILLADFQKMNPQILPAVPRVFEALYDGINRAMRKTGGVVYALYRFFSAVGILHAQIDRRLFRKQARFGNDYIVLMWILLILPWLFLYPLKALGSVLVFRKIREKMGTAFRGGVSGGGALPPQVDNFFWAVGINVVEGYGITETAPVVSVRPFDNPIFGTVGTPLRGVEVRIVDDTGHELPVGEKGCVLVRGGTVMKGYYKRDDLTAKAIDSDGWFNTGDIGMKTVNGEIVLRGRIKDTIVLRGGENIEPLPIEMKMNESRFVSQSVVLGQDERYLAIMIVPSKEDLKSFATENSIKYETYNQLLQNEDVLKLFENEIKTLISAKNGFKMFERISKFTLLEKPFEVGVELSAKQEIMRYKLNELYAKEIKQLFK